MTEQRVQNYQNHVRNDFLFYTYTLLCLVAMITALVGIGLDNTRVTGGAVVILSLASALMSVRTRTYGLTVQDRVVRLEMRLRLRELLDPALASRIGELSVKQLAALRFASDSELPELAKKVIEEGIRDTKAIKRMVKDWQADFLRV